MDMEEGRSIELNSPGAYPTCCVELTLDGLSVNTVLQSQHINDYEGGSGTGISFDYVPQVLIAVTHVRDFLSGSCSHSIPRFQGIAGGADRGRRDYCSLCVRRGRSLLQYIQVSHWLVAVLSSLVETLLEVS